MYYVLFENQTLKGCVCKMDTLQDRAYQVYAENLSVKKKQRLIARLEGDIDEAYAKWRDTTNAFLKAHSLGFKVCDTFSGYSLSEKRGVLTSTSRQSTFAFYIVDEKIGFTEWDDMGSPHSSVIELDRLEQSKFCDDTKMALRMFVATHPQLQ